MLTCELWDAVGPLLRTEVEAISGRPPKEIGMRPAPRPYEGDDGAAKLFQPPDRRFALAILDRDAVIFIYRELPSLATTVSIPSVGGRRG